MMQDTAQRFRTTVRLNEPVMRAAEQAAAAVNVTVAKLFEILLVDYVCAGTRMSDAPPAPAPRSNAKVIELKDVRQRRHRESR
jgi:hypothetical protein